MNVEKLSKEELLKLKQKVDNNLNKIQQEEIKLALIDMSDKTKLSQLVPGSKIFGIRMSGKSNNGIIRLDWKVDIVDFCEVTEYWDSAIRVSKLNRLTISHPNKRFDFTAALSNEDVDKHYVLDINSSKNGYAAFFTLKPKTWKEDIINAFNDIVDKKRNAYESEVVILGEKLDVFVNSSSLINLSVLAHPQINKDE